MVRPHRYVMTGSTRVMECCVFFWEELEGSTERTAVVAPHHCARCLDEVRRLGFQLQDPGGGGPGRPFSSTG